MVVSYSYYPSTSSSSGPVCSNTCRTIIGCVIAAVSGAVLIGSIIFLCCRTRGARAQQANSDVIHVSNNDPNGPPPPYPPLQVNAYQPGYAQWPQQPPPPPQPQPQPMYGVPLAQPTDPNHGVVPLGYTPTPYAPAAGEYAYDAPHPPPGQYGGYAYGGGAAAAAGPEAGNAYYTRSADADCDKGKSSGK